MTRLVTNLLDMVRVETGALAMHKEWQPLEEALGVALLRLEERLAAHAVDDPLAARPAPGADRWAPHRAGVHQPAGERREAHAAGEPRSRSLPRPRGSVVVEVADQGPGIPSGEEENVFREVLSRGAGGSGRPAGGSGLGLTICRGIVAAHGGRIWLERRAGWRACFRFTLPLEGPPAGPARRRAS